MIAQRHVVLLALLACTSCGEEGDAGRDAALSDAGATDGGFDAGPRDAGARDSGARDSGARDSGARDAAVDAGGPPSPLIFSTMGDVPYSAAGATRLQADITRHNSSSPSRFVVHVGDIKPGSNACVEAIYRNTAGYLGALTAPTFVLVGDNEWNDCDDPAAAWGMWTTYFSRFDERWPSAPTVERQLARDENFAWVDRGVLLIGINLVGGRVHDASEWDTRLADDAQWVEEQFDRAPDSVFAAVLFAHANPSPDHAAFMTRFLAAADSFTRPILFIHGDGHVWIQDRPWPEGDILRVQVDRGDVASPVQVTVTPGEIAPFTFERDPFR